MNKRDYPKSPNKSITLKKHEDNWKKIASDCHFKLNLYLKCWINVVTSKRKAIEGYYRETDRNTNSINISPHSILTEIHSSIEARTLSSFKKSTIDRLGNFSKIN